MNQSTFYFYLDGIKTLASQLTTRVASWKGKPFQGRRVRARDTWYDAILLARECQALVAYLEEENEELRAERAAWSNPVFAPDGVKS
jgi:hypothetical protein